MKKGFKKYMSALGVGLLVMGFTACGSSSGGATGATGNAQQTNQANASMGRAIMASSLSSVQSLQGALPSAQVAALRQTVTEEESVDSDIDMNCSLYDSEGNEVLASEVAPEDEWAYEIVCEGTCNEDESGIVQARLGLDESGNSSFTFEFHGCQVETCDGLVGMTGGGTVAFNAETETGSWDLDFEMENGTSVSFDMSVDYSEEGAVYDCGCERYSGEVTINDTTYPAQEICEADLFNTELLCEETDASDEASDDESDDEASDEGDEASEEDCEDDDSEGYDDESSEEDFDDESDEESEEDSDDEEDYSDEEDDDDYSDELEDLL